MAGESLAESLTKKSCFYKIILALRLPACKM